MTGWLQEPQLTDPRPIFRDICHEVVGACKEGADRLLVQPSLEGLWTGGLSYEEGQNIRKTSDDLTWWFVEAFADPAVAEAVKKILDSVPDFFFKVASLSSDPVNIDWNLINQLRNHLRVAAWPPPYIVAANSTKSEASTKAAELIRRFTRAEEWQQRF